MLLAVNGFCTAARVPSVENFGESQAAQAVSPPLIDALPPDQSQPFIDKSFRPLAMRPPSDAKLFVIPGSRHRVIMSRDFAAKNAESTPGVEIGGYNQHSFLSRASQAPLYIFRLVPG